MKLRTILFGLFVLTLTNCSNDKPQPSSEVTIVGEMRSVMWDGELGGKIDLQTISDKENLYGLGPVEYLRGEIMILDGRAYKSTVTSDTTMKVEETYRIKAPFFGYATIAEWSEQSLPDSIQTIQQLEEYLDSATKTSPRPFMFKLSGVAEEALIHIVNLPEGTEVRSPAEAHQGQTDYPLYNEEFEIVGFFSTEHQRIFTHHDTYLHMHLITTDRQKMGHLDDVLFEKGTLNLSLPSFASHRIAEEENGTEW